MRFYFPDSQDQIDPSFDFRTEQRSVLRVRQRDDLYAHEVLRPTPYRGLLVSKAIIDGVSGAGRYSAQQRQRLFREGIREFFRLDSVPGERVATMGDCGAFGYVREEHPPYSVDEVIDFYEECGFDAGVSIDHVILGFDARERLSPDLVPDEWRRRHAITLDLAASFYERHQARGCTFEAIGVAQGWSPDSYASTVEDLQEIGYERIALGGLVPLKSHEILASLEAVDAVRARSTQLHLFGVTRCEHVATFQRYGVTSFDSTSPFRQAFKDDRDNYWTLNGSHLALRVPQIEGNAKLQSRIRAGEIDQRIARNLEQNALRTLDAYDAGGARCEEALAALLAYEKLHNDRWERVAADRIAAYRSVLEAQAWKECPCRICRDAGIHVMLFRGTERNKRRGFHNLHVFARRLRRQMRRSASSEAIAA
jgi:hypothetical protein